jgi:hypothetical protein
MAQYRSPPQLNFEEPKWDIWKAQFLTFRQVTKLNNEDEEVQVASLKYCMGYDAEEIVKTFGLTSAEEKNFSVVLKKFEAYFKPKVNVIRLRRIFQRRLQHSTESEELYLRSLYTAAQDCEFGILKKERIRDQFIAGLRDDRLAEKLEHLYLSNRDSFTLDLVVEYTRTYCDVKEGRKREDKYVVKECVQEVSDDCYIEAVSNNQFTKNKQPHSGRMNCSYCGLVHQPKKCPAYGRQCAACGKQNHFAKVCRSRPTNHSHEMMGSSRRPEVNVVSTSVYEEEPFFLGECHSNNLSTNHWIVNIIVGLDDNMQFKVDTGADVCLMNYNSYLKLLTKPKLLISDKKLMTPVGELKVIGKFNTKIAYKNVVLDEQIYVMPKNVEATNLLSRSAAQYLNIVKFIGDVSMVDSSLFGFGCWNTEPVKFHVKLGTIPFAINTARKLAFKLFQPVKDALTKMVNGDIIESVTTPTDWASGIVPVQKADGKNVRICVDFRNLNRNLRREVYHIPTFDELSHKLSGVKLMSKIDAASGFFQIPLDESARDFTTFLTPFGRYRFKRLPMGVNIAPEIYQRKMCELLEGIEGVLIYIWMM